MRSEVSRSGAQLARYLYYLGRIRAVQLEYSEAKDCLQQAARKVGGPPDESNPGQEADEGLRSSRVLRLLSPEQAAARRSSVIEGCSRVLKYWCTSAMFPATVWCCLGALSQEGRHLTGLGARMPAGLGK